MAVNENLESIFEILDGILKDTSFDDVTSESAGKVELKDGYYLAEVVKADFTSSKKSKQPMVAIGLKTVENGYSVDEDNGNLTEIEKSKGLFANVYYVLKDEKSVKRFASDMMKFEEEEGVPLLPKEAFTSANLIAESLDALVGSQIYINVSTTENDDGTKSSWTNLISWKRADALELPM